MGVLEIKKYPDKILRTNCQLIEAVTDNELQLFQDMLFTMHHFSGLGLAAPQIGVNQRVFVADVGKEQILLANPEIIEVKGREKMEEGCLSISDTVVEVVRSEEIVAQGLNERGQLIEIKAKGLLARVIQHEIDHLNGKLIIDYMNIFQIIRRKLDRKWRNRNA